MYGEMGKQSNTILFNERPADVTALMAQAMTALRVTDSGFRPPADVKAIDSNGPSSPAAATTDRRLNETPGQGVSGEESPSK